MFSEFMRSVNTGKLRGLKLNVHLVRDAEPSKADDVSPFGSYLVARKIQYFNFKLPGDINVFQQSEVYSVDIFVK